VRTADQVHRQRITACRRPRAVAAPRRVVPAELVAAAALVLVLAVLALHARGSLEVARGSSSAPASVVLVSEGVRVTVGSVVAEPAGTAAESTTEAGDTTPMRRVAVYLHVRNAGRKVATFTPLDVALRDDQGEVYAAYDPRWSRSPALPGSALEPGGQVGGWRVFQVPATQFEYVLLYSSGGMDPAVEARLPRLWSGRGRASLEPLVQLPQEAQLAGVDR